MKLNLSYTPEYRVWAGMIQRCTNPNNPKYDHYGGRGITICKEWRKFKNFYSDMGPKPTPEHSIDRINNDGNYEPSNCRWTTTKIQNYNRHTSNQNTNKTHCKNGHEFTEENTYIAPQGNRSCRICLRIYNKNYIRYN